jgi:transposase
MSLAAVFPQLRGFHLEQVCTDTDELTVVATSTQRTALCPLCCSLASQVHSRYQRRITDLPCAGRTVMLLTHARRFFCRNPHCPRRTFRERLPTVAAPRARSTHGVRAALTCIGFALGGAAGARLARLLGLPTSDATMLRLVRAMPGPPVGQPRVLGIDDWAWRKGSYYGTMICDLEQRRPVRVPSGWHPAGSRTGHRHGMAAGTSRHHNHQPGSRRYLYRGRDARCTGGHTGCRPFPSRQEPR